MLERRSEGLGRRRNKFAGMVRSFQQDSRAMTIQIDILEALGNCPSVLLQACGGSR